MTWFGRLLGFADDGSARPRDPHDDFWWGATPYSTAAGEAVTIARALQLPVVLNSLTVLAGSVSTLPSGVVRSDTRGGRRTSTPEPEHPVSRLLKDPNAEQTGPEFVAEQIHDLATAGDWIGELRGGGSEIRRHDPECTQVERLDDGSRRWTVHDGMNRRRLTEGEVWHIRRVPLKKGLTGTGPIEAGREVIAKGLAIQAYAARFFANDVTPPIVLEHPTAFADRDSRRNYLKAIKKAMLGRNRHSPMLLEHGIKASKIGTTNEEAQFLDTARESNIDLARLWNMPPHKVGILDRATFSNIEQQSLDYVTDTLMPWLTLIEASVGKVFLSRDRRQSRKFEFNVAGLLRGDIKSRYLSYAVARQWGWLSQNDIRRLESMNPVGGGDVYLQPMNMEPAGSGASVDRVNRALDVLHTSIESEVRSHG